MSVTEEIVERVGRLTPEQQQRVLDFVRTVSATSSDPPEGARLADLMQFAGTIPAADLREMEEAIEAECEQVNPNGW